MQLGREWPGSDQDQQCCQINNAHLFICQTTLKSKIRYNLLHNTQFSTRIFCSSAYFSQSAGEWLLQGFHSSQAEWRAVGSLGNQQGEAGFMLFSLLVRFRFARGVSIFWKVEMWFWADKRCCSSGVCSAQGKEPGEQFPLLFQPCLGLEEWQLSLPSLWIYPGFFW